MTDQSAFQSNAFQNNAFQTEGIEVELDVLDVLRKPYTRYPHGAPIAAAFFGRKESEGLERFSRGPGGSVAARRGSSTAHPRFFKRRGSGDDQGSATPTRD